MTSLPRPNSLTEQPRKKLHVDLTEALGQDNPLDDSNHSVLPEEETDIITRETSEEPAIDTAGREGTKRKTADDSNFNQLEKQRENAGSSPCESSWCSYAEIAASDDAFKDVDEMRNSAEGNIDDGDSQKNNMSLSARDAQLEKASRVKFESIMQSYVNGATPVKLTLDINKPNETTKSFQKRSPIKNQPLQIVNSQVKRPNSNPDMQRRMHRKESLSNDSMSGVKGQTLSKKCIKNAHTTTKSTMNGTEKTTHSQSTENNMTEIEADDRNTETVDELAAKEDATTSEMPSDDIQSTLCERQSIPDESVVEEVVEEILEGTTPTEERQSGNEDFTNAPKTHTVMERKQMNREPITPRKLPPGRVIECSVATVNKYDIDGEYHYMLGKALDTYTKYKRQEQASARALLLEKALRDLQERKRNAFPNRPLTPRVRDRRLRVKSTPPLAILPNKGVKVITPKLPEATVLPGDIIEKVGQVNDLSIGTLRQRPQSAFPARSQMSKSMDDKLHNKLFTPRPSMFESASTSPSSKSIDSGSKQQQQRKGATDSHFVRTSKQSKSESNYRYKGGFFSANSSPRKGYFTVHPEWVSENFSVQKLSLNDSSNKYATYPPRRCRSAPPPARRNPITWQ